ncbi:ABC transporter substrate-binding protein [Aeropyrum camini]|uniref:ABC transporter substrate-binding protein n=2 Tax=Aeropyrum camini TaxID=229980 RepID=U3TC19_9CREN|nr:ABC transporter substrate-binding protein [Aeropyrum camini]BAN89493.1 ABC transporter substrate-binding protein [Aeropyrum camini SY1 = JCM 12091]
MEASRSIAITAGLLIVVILISLFSYLSITSRIESIEQSISSVQEDISEVQQKISNIEQEVRGIKEAAGAETTTPTIETETKTETVVVEKVTLTVIGPWSGKEQEYFMTVLEKFMEENPNITIKYVPMRAEEVARTLSVQFEAGVTPADVVITPWAWWIVEMAQKGHVVEVTGLINEDEYVGGILDSVKWNNKLWGVPFTMWLKPGFWYKKSFFAKHGLSEPNSWDEFLQLLDQIKGIEGIKNPIVSGDSVGWPLSDVTEHFIIAFGGPELQYKLITGEVSFTDPQVVEIFERLTMLIEQGYFSEPIEWTGAVEKWWAEEYALYFMGTWITGMVEDPNDLAFFPLPGARGVVGGTDYAFIPKYTENLDAAKLLLQYLATEGQAVHVSTPAGKVPTWLGVDTDQLWPPMQGVFAKIKELNMTIVPDLDDTIGGDWQVLFWDQLKLLWVQPDRLNEVLQTLASEHPAAGGG